MCRIIWILVLSSLVSTLVAGNPIESERENDQQLSNGPANSIHKRSLSFSYPSGENGGSDLSNLRSYPVRQALTDDQLINLGAMSSSIRDYPPHGLKSGDYTTENFLLTPKSTLIETEKPKFLSNWNNLRYVLQNGIKNDADLNQENDTENSFEHDSDDLDNLSTFDNHGSLPTDFSIDSPNTVYFVGGRYNVSLVLDKDHPLSSDFTKEKKCTTTIHKTDRNEDSNDFAGPYLPIYDCKCKPRKMKKQRTSDIPETDDGYSNSNLAFVDGQYVKKGTVETNNYDVIADKVWRTVSKVLTVIDETDNGSQQNTEQLNEIGGVYERTQPETKAQEIVDIQYPQYPRRNSYTIPPRLNYQHNQRQPLMPGMRYQYGNFPPNGHQTEPYRPRCQCNQNERYFEYQGLPYYEIMETYIPFPNPNF